MSLLDLFEKLINEHGSSTILREHLALIKAQQTALERQNTDLQTEKQALKSEIEQNRIDLEQLQQQIASLQTGTHTGYACDHCGSPRLNRIGNRPDPTFSALGIKQAVFSCTACGRESAFTQNPS